MVKNKISKVVLYGWFYPFLISVLSIIAYYFSGCSGGYIDSELECYSEIYEFFGPILEPYNVFGMIYLIFSFPFYLLYFINELANSSKEGLETEEKSNSNNLSSFTKVNTN